jgi:hypothetical protein
MQAYAFRPGSRAVACRSVSVTWWFSVPRSPRSWLPVFLMPSTTLSPNSSQRRWRNARFPASHLAKSRRMSVSTRATSGRRRSCPIKPSRFQNSPSGTPPSGASSASDQPYLALVMPQLRNLSLDRQICVPEALEPGLQQKFPSSRHPNASCLQASSAVPTRRNDT